MEFEDFDSADHSSPEDFYVDENLVDEELNPLEEDIEMVDRTDDPEGNDEEANDYEIISVEKVAEGMNERISEVSSIIDLPKTITRILLSHFRWDKDKLIDKYYDGDQEKLFTDAHIVNPFDANKSKDPNETNECQVCFTTVESSDMAGLPCGHLFCTECWGEYLKTKITSDGEAESITCVAYKCGILVDDNTVTSLLKDPADKAKYQRFIMNSFVEANSLFKWCPSAGCDSIIKAKSPKQKIIICKCSHVFCFGCGENNHEPIDCVHLRKWVKKCNDDSETMNWISANTKDCPNCNAIIEKNGGCNHMTCKKCTKSFCWICLKPWERHGGGCGLYDSSDPGNPNVNSRAALQKYLFYWNRFMSHQQSLKLEAKLYDTLEVKMNELINIHNQSWMDVRYLKDAVDILRNNRQTLSYTFAFAFYNEKNNQFLIFEDNQNDLHEAVENLSGYLERDIAYQNFLDIKIKVLDLCRYCEERRKALLRHVREGNEKNWWTFSDTAHSKK